MEEERWIRMLRSLNVLPIIVCFLIAIIVIGLGAANSILLFPLLIFCIVVYALIYFTELDEQRNDKMVWIFALNLILTTCWLIIFYAISAELLRVIHIMSILVSAFIVGYPLCMLYYNFKLFMNEISKPSWHADDADVPPQIVTDFCS